MLYTPRDSGPIESYKSYKNRTVTKFLNRHKELLSGIKYSSLKESDKKNLVKELLHQLSSSEGKKGE